MWIFLSAWCNQGNCNTIARARVRPENRRSSLGPEEFSEVIKNLSLPGQIPMNGAIEITVSHWYNLDNPPSLAELRGRPVLIHAFQMLCPACVAHGTPQAQRAHRPFS
jgi:hypothetical protein